MLRKVTDKLRAFIARRRDLKTKYTLRERARMEAIMRGELKRVEEHYMKTIVELTEQHKRKILEQKKLHEQEMNARISRIKKEHEFEVRELKRELRVAEGQLQRARKAFLLWRDHLEEVDLVTDFMQTEAKGVLDSVASIYKRFSQFHDTVSSIRHTQVKREPMIRELLEIEEDEVRPLLNTLLNANKE